MLTDPATRSAVTRPHHNVFFYYRGPSARESRQEGERYQQQVEDNSTKALVNALEHAGPDVVRSFLRRFAPALADGWPPRASPEFFLQRGPTGALPSGRRLLHGLSVLGEVEGPLVASEDGSRVDAAILLAGVGLLAVEVKVVDDLDGPQLARHAQRWGVVEEPPAGTVGRRLALGARRAPATERHRRLPPRAVLRVPGDPRLRAVGRLSGRGL
jgi:hypothetical protein